MQPLIKTDPITALLAETERPLKDINLNRIRDLIVKVAEEMPLITVPQRRIALDAIRLGFDSAFAIKSAQEVADSLFKACCTVADLPE